MKSDRDREPDGFIRIDEARRTDHVLPANENAAPLATVDECNDMEFEIEFEPEEETRH